MPIEPVHTRRIAAGVILAASAFLSTLPAAAQPQAAPPTPPAPHEGPVALRVATFNIEDLRTDELKGQPSDRVRRAVEIIQRIRPNIIFINEITYDSPGDPHYTDGDPVGGNAARLAALLATPVAEGLSPLRMNAWSANVNTGRASGYDFDRDGTAVTLIPPQPPRGPDGSPPPQPQEGRAYGNDAWGFGTYPGQYGMALLVDERLRIDDRYIRTFRIFPWSFMPGALVPMTTAADGTPEPWYAGEAGQVFRLSSKSHWDVPVRLPNGALLHLLCSHPTPPVFDGPEQRNKMRNHDEIRFWADYVDNAAYIVDENQRPGGLPSGAHFVILGDLNADPDEGDSINDPIGLLMSAPAVGPDHRPIADLDLPDLNPDDTAGFGLRVDYIIQSRTITVQKSAIWRRPPASGPFPSDHFPVWADIIVPAANQ